MDDAGDGRFRDKKGGTAFGFRAGRGQAGGASALLRVQLLPLVCSTPAWSPFAVWGSSLGKDQLVVKLYCVGLQHFREPRSRGFLASRKSGGPSCFADASERGVSPSDPESVATTFGKEKKSRVCLAEKQNQQGVDAIGVDGDTMTSCNVNAQKSTQCKTGRRLTSLWSSQKQRV